MESAPAIREVWEQYRAQPTKHLRDQLILNYSPLVKFVAGRVSAGLPHTIEQADLVSYGIFGLMDAIDRYDPGVGAKFETYAITRIKGAIIDELRAVDWVPRTVRAKAKAVEEAYAVLEGRLGRGPTDAEVAAEMAVSEDDLQKIYSETSYVGLVALDEVIGGHKPDSGSTALVDTLPADGDEPLAAVEVEEMKRILMAEIGRLSDRERMVLALYYFEGLTLSEIGDVIGVTESRVCQIHTRAILHVRGRMAMEERRSA